MKQTKIGTTDFLNSFGLSAISKKILLDIIGHGLSSVADIAARLNMPKSTIYDSISPLLVKSLINEYNDGGGKKFGISETDQLSRAHAIHIEELQKAQASLLSFIQNQKSTDDVARPRIKFYMGTLGIKQAFRDISWSKNIAEAYLMWPVKDMIDIDEEFFRWHGTQRLKHGVIINAIEKHSDRALQVKKHQWLVNDFKTNLVRIRYLPKNVDWKMSYWIYGNKCLFASGGREKIAFTVHSKEFCQLMKLMWQSMWEQALP